MVLVDKILIALGIDPKGAQEGLDRIDHHIDHTDNKIKNLQNHAKGAAKHMIMSLAAPLLAAFSVGKVIQGYISDVAQVAEQTGAYSKQLEEARLKQAMLQRVTKEDVELYKRGREALVKFQIATADFGAALVRTAMPALKWLLDKLNGFTDWFSHNQNNIIRFLQVLASVITVALIPSVVKFTAALLKNPLAWVAGLVLALALAIDDLIVYLKGGRSEFDAFWKWLGFTKGDTETLTKAVNWLKTSGVDLLKTIGKVTAAFVAMRAVASVLMMVQKAWNALSLSILANPIVLAIGLLIAAGWMLYKNWDGVCEGIAALLEKVENAWQKAVDWTADLFQSIDDGAHALVNDACEKWDSLVNRVSHVFGVIGGILSAFRTAASEKAAAAGDAISTAFNSALNAVKGVWQGMKEGASALVDDIENAFSGLTQWFSALWGKITGIFDRALGKIKSGISSVTDALGITDSKREEREELAERTPTDPEFERQKAAIIEMRRSKTGSYDTDDYLMQHPVRRPGERNVTKGTLMAADKVKALQAQMTAYSLGMQKAAGVKAAPVNSGAVSNVRNTTQKSTINNDNRRQEVNITVNGNADRGTAQQIGTSVTDVFKSGAMSPVAG